MSNVVDYGVFVQLPERHLGLLHISNVSYVKVDNLSDIFRPGDKVKVRAGKTNKFCAR